MKTQTKHVEASQERKAVKKASPGFEEYYNDSGLFSFFVSAV